MILKIKPGALGARPWPSWGVERACDGGHKARHFSLQTVLHWYWDSFTNYILNGWTRQIRKGRKKGESEFDHICHNFTIIVRTMHRQLPRAVGSRAASRVHLQLPVSLLMVSRVVPQGQWKRAKMMKLRAVSQVQPLAVKTARMAARSSTARRESADR